MNKVCVICGNVFYARTKATKVCSEECRAKYISIYNRTLHNMDSDVRWEWEKAVGMFKNVKWVKAGTPEAKGAKKLGTKRGVMHGAYS